MSLNKMNLSKEELKIAELAVLNSRIEIETKQLANDLRIKVLSLALEYEKSIQESGYHACFSGFLNFLETTDFDFSGIDDRQLFRIIDSVFSLVYTKLNTIAYFCTLQNFNHNRGIKNESS